MTTWQPARIGDVDVEICSFFKSILVDAVLNVIKLLDLLVVAFAVAFELVEVGQHVTGAVAGQAIQILLLLSPKSLVGLVHAMESGSRTEVDVGGRETSVVVADDLVGTPCGSVTPKTILDLSVPNRAAFATPEISEFIRETVAREDLFHILMDDLGSYLDLFGIHAPASTIVTLQGFKFSRRIAME